MDQGHRRRPGGFSVEFGNATGGSGVTLGDIKTDSVHGHLDVNVFHAALITAPVSEHWSIGAAFDAAISTPFCPR